MNDDDVKALRQRARKMKTSELVAFVAHEPTKPTNAFPLRAAVYEAEVTRRSVCASELDERIPARET